MALREKLLPIFDKIARTKMETFGLRTNGLTIRKRTHLGVPGVDGYVDEDLVISPKPRIRTVSSREIAGSGGRYLEGDIRIDRITPQYTDASGTHGYTPAQIKPIVARGVDVLYVVTGPAAGDHELVDERFDRAFGYSLTIRRKRRTP